MSFVKAADTRDQRLAEWTARVAASWVMSASDDEPGERPGKAEQILFGRNLRAARRRIGLTQIQLSAATGIAQPDISVIENGGDNLTVETMARLAAAVGTTLRELLDSPSP